MLRASKNTGKQQDPLKVGNDKRVKGLAEQRPPASDTREPPNTDLCDDLQNNMQCNNLRNPKGSEKTTWFVKQLIKTNYLQLLGVHLGKSNCRCMLVL